MKDKRPSKPRSITTIHPEPERNYSGSEEESIREREKKRGSYPKVEIHGASTKRTT